MEIDEVRLQFDAHREFEEIQAYEATLGIEVSDDLFMREWYPAWERLAAYMEDQFPGFGYRSGSPEDENLTPPWSFTSAGWFFESEHLRIFIAPEWPRDHFASPGEDSYLLAFRGSDLTYEGTVAGGTGALDSLLSTFLHERQATTPARFDAMWARAPIMAPGSGKSLQNVEPYLHHITGVQDSHRHSFSGTAAQHTHSPARGSGVIFADVSLHGEGHMSARGHSSSGEEPTGE